VSLSVVGALSEMNKPGAGTSSDTYWCAQEPRLTIRDAQERIIEWAQAQDYSGRTARWRQAYNTYYSVAGFQGYNGSDIRVTGEMGEIIAVRVNVARNVALHAINLVTQDVLSFQTVAHDDSHQAQESNDIAKKLLNHLVKEKNLPELRYRGAEIAFVFDSAYHLTTWDMDAGEEGEPQVQEDGSVKETRKGDVRFEVFEPWNVVFPLRSSALERDWYAFRRWVNKWDLIALKPDLREQILKLRTRDQLERGLQALPWLAAQQMRSEDVCVWELYHRKSPALPNGRMLRFCDEDVVFFDGPLPYERIPVREVRVAEMVDTALGYTSFYDVMGLATINDAMWSTIVSVADLGFGNWCVPSQSNFQAIDGLVGGGKLLEYEARPDLPDGGKPSLVEMPPVPEVIFKTATSTAEQIGSLLSVSETSRGKPPPETKTASGQALQVEQDAAFWTQFRQRIVRAMEGIGQDTLDCFSRFADQQRVVELEGPDHAMEALSFLGEDLSGTRKVRVDQGGPQGDGPAGRRATLEWILQNFPGRLSADDAMEFLRTGLLEPIFDSEAGTDELISDENQKLGQYNGPTPLTDGTPPEAPQAIEAMHAFVTTLGSQVTVDPTDDHMRHVKGHSKLLRDPKIRFNPKAVAAIHAHLAAHQEFLMGAAPPPPGPPGPGGPQAAPGGPPPPGPGDGLPRPPQAPPQAPKPPSGAPETPVPRGAA
jgi:hypothetical protein